MRPCSVWTTHFDEGGVECSADDSRVEGDIALDVELLVDVLEELRSSAKPGYCCVQVQSYSLSIPLVSARLDCGARFNAIPSKLSQYCIHRLARSHPPARQDSNSNAKPRPAQSQLQRSSLAFSPCSFLNLCSREPLPKAAPTTRTSTSRLST